MEHLHKNRVSDIAHVIEEANRVLLRDSDEITLAACFSSYDCFRRIPVLERTLINGITKSAGTRKSIASVLAS